MNNVAKCSVSTLLCIVYCLSYGVDLSFSYVLSFYRAMVLGASRQDQRNVGVSRKERNDDGGLPTFITAIVGGGALGSPRLTIIPPGPGPPVRVRGEGAP